MRSLSCLFAIALLTAGPVARANDIAVAALGQVGVTVQYDPSYRQLGFPNGDVPRERGVCTDVVIRALRDARRIDLQQAVNRDLSANWDDYPHRWREQRSQPDPNIDHRRVPNLMTYFERQKYARTISADGRDYAAGDIVAWDLGGGTLHIGIVSTGRSRQGTPLVVHNIGRGTQEEDVLFSYRIIGHYRLPPAT